MSAHDPTSVALRLGTELVRARDEREAAAATARASGLFVDADCVRVWLLDRTRGYRFAGAWPDTDADPDAPPDEIARVVAFGAPALSDAEPPYRSRLILPLLAGLRPLGAVELLEKKRASGPFMLVDAGNLQELIQAADEALLAVREASRREHGTLAAITRLTRLFDIGRSIAESIEQSEVERTVVNRIATAMDVQNAYMWLLDAEGEKLEVASAAGPAAEVVLEWELRSGEGAAGRVAETQEAILIDDAEDVEALGWRPDADAGLEIDSIALVPVISADQELLGVLEAVNKDEDESLARPDLGMLREIADSAAIAIVNARRLDAERRASDLGQLLEVAQEICSHLDMQKVTFALVHRAASVLGYSRAAVGLLRGTQLELAAVSGHEFVDESLTEIKVLTSVMTWAAGLDEGVYVVQEDDGSIDTDRPETREKFNTYFEQSGSRSFLTIPLADDEGKLGLFSLESTEPYGFSERDIEAAGLLGVQATVAIRNALLYRSLPMASVLRPWARSQKGGAESRWRSWGKRTAAAAAVAALLVFVPVPLRVGGAARVLPELYLPVTPAVEGRVVDVRVREGDPVQAGTILAVLDDSELRTGREDARARYHVALRERDRFQAGGRPAEAAVEQARIDGLRAEVELWEERLEWANLRSPVAGIVATPRVEEQLGSRFEPGQVFCDIVDPRRQRIEVAVREADAGLLDVGMSVKVKLHAYPTRSFRATVEKIGVTATLESDARVFLVRARLDDPQVQLRSGMTGQAKIDTGPAALGRVVFRKPARWLWGVFWGWLP